MSIVGQDNSAIAEEPRITKIVSALSRPSVYALSTLIVTVLGSATTLIAPALLTPSEFASFVLLASFFQLTSRLDFGLSELADRYGTRLSNWDLTASHFIKLRWMIGLASLPVVLLIVLFNSQWGSLISSADLLITLSGGLFAMIAVGPVTIFRAQNNIKEFASLALILQLGMTVPRLLGIALGGTAGCYTALLLWYIVFASQSRRFLRPLKLSIGETLSPLSESTPLFLSGLLWLSFQFIPRWISAFISQKDDFASLAFAFSLMALTTGTLTTIGQAYYPRYIVLARENISNKLRPIFFRDMIRLVCLSFLVYGAFLPLLPYGVFRFYPRYAPALYDTVMMLLALIPLVPMLWFMPIMLSITKHPLRFMSLVTLPSSIIQFFLMNFFYSHMGREGQALALLIGILISLILFSVCLVSEKLLLRSRAFIFIGIIILSIGLLFGERQWLLGANDLFTFSLPDYNAPRLSDSFREQQSAKSNLLFSEEFNHLRLINEDPDGVWEPYFLWGDRSISQNGELQYYVDPRIGGDEPILQSKNALSVRDGILHLRAITLSEKEQYITHGHPFISGMLSSARRFSFTYGYVEIRARMPKGAGLWPALWLLPVSQAWPPEIDIAEVIGKTPTRYYASLHAREFGFRINSTFPIDTYDLSERFSTFGMKWTREKIEWTFNGMTVAECDTPSDLHQPMYLLVNLAVGGLWGGIPEEPNVFPADLMIDYIRVYDIER